MTQSLKICVKQCPNRILSTMEDICKFYKETGSQLCHDRPGGDFSACKSGSSIFKNGSCPERPVYPSIPVLNRCIPKAVKEVSETIISNLYGVINSWDVIEQVLGDLCKTWRQILALSFLAFGRNLMHYCMTMDIHNPYTGYLLIIRLFLPVLSLFTISIFHLLAGVVTWIIIVLVSIASTGELYFGRAD